jgi:ribonuclease R
MPSKFIKKNQIGLSKKDLTPKILSFFEKSPVKQFNYKQVASDLGILTREDRTLLLELLEQLSKEGVLKQEQRGKFRLKKIPTSTISGTIEFIKSGAAFVRGDNLKEDIYIPSGMTKDAFHGDEVSIVLKPSNKKKPEGEVTQVINRVNKEFVGVIEIGETFAFVAPTSRKIHTDFYISKENLNGAKTGEKVIVSFMDWPSKAKNPFGKVKKVLGIPGENDVEMHAILAEFGLPFDFPEEVLKAADKISSIISQEEIKARKDFRKIVTFTIDPEDAKDFDDAISLLILENGNIEVGVHIADVSHYLKKNSILDKEALNRATSVYLVDRVVPMLPEILSNNLCSLRPNEEKLCFSAVFELDQNALVVKEWFGKTIILSDRRFSYEEAQEIIETKTGDFAQEIVLLDGLAKKMRAVRMGVGAIEFGSVEVKFKLDDKGKPVSVYHKVMKDSNRLIEDFMLLANRRTAEWVGKLNKPKKPFVYRIHDEPDPEKLRVLKLFVNRLGHKINFQKGGSAAGPINELLKNVTGTPEEDIIKQMSIRAMAKAVYTTQNIGHYGLAFEYYTHFTSPIRRYPDVISHRLLSAYLNGENGETEEAIELQCKHSSLMEKKAVEAERASIKYKQVEFMLDKIGQTFSGLISGITNWGIYVEILENRCEGMVSFQSMDDDRYYFDEENYKVVGSKYKTEYNFGDEVKIIVKSANLFSKQLDYLLV